MPRTPSLDALRIFVVAARHLSFTAAANEMNLTQSAVSHRICGLEEELGIRLFTRLTRRLELTAQGRLLAQRVELAIGQIDRSVVDLANSPDASPLKVTMLSSVATHWLIPRLARMQCKHLDFEVQVIADPHLLDLRARGIDLAIRFGRTPHPGYAGTRLMSDCVLPVCTPDLLRQYGSISSVDETMAMPLLHDLATNSDGSGSDWQSWLDFVGRPDVNCSTGLYFNDASMLINAAMLGLGVSLARASLVTEQLASGTLVSPLQLAAPTAYSYWLLGLPEAVNVPRIELFRELLLAEAIATEKFVDSIRDPVRQFATALVAA